MAKFEDWHTHSKLPFCSLKMEHAADKIGDEVDEDEDLEETQQSPQAGCSLGSVFNLDVAQ